MVGGNKIDFGNKELLLRITQNKRHILSLTDNVYSYSFLSYPEDTHCPIDIRQDVWLMYEELDMVVSGCKFSQYRKRILNLVYGGFTLGEIAIVLGKTYNNIKVTFYNMVEKIIMVYENDFKERG